MQKNEDKKSDKDFLELLKVQNITLYKLLYELEKKNTRSSNIKSNNQK